MMKKILPLLLVLLLLAGCGTAEVTEPSDTTEAVTESEQKGLYVPQSAVEQQTGGAVRMYLLDQTDYFSISAMGNRLLLRSEDGVLSVLQGDACELTASLPTGTLLQGTSLQFDASVQGAAYYDPDNQQVVQVNPQLQEVGRITMPEDMQGQPYISMTQEEVFYCVPGEVRALNMQTGVSRLIRSHSYPKQGLQGIWFDGQMLLISFYDEENFDLGSAYISTQTGKTLYESEGPLYPFYTDEDAYVLNYVDGGVSQTVTGSREGTHQVIRIPEEKFASALAMGGIIGYEAADGLQLAFYEVESGKCTSRVTLSGISDPKAVLTTQEAVWVLAFEGQTQVLCKWDPAATPTDDETVYTSALFTADNPDVEGLEACSSRVSEMSKQYGVKIHIWEEALESTAEGNVPMPEHQVSTIHSMLDELAVALEQFPTDFLRKTVEAGWIHVNLVRSLSGDDTFNQYWQDGDCYITITNTGNVTEDFYRGVAYAIDSHVLGNSRKFDDWNDLNPSGFTYSYSDEPHPDRDTYLNAEERVFLTEKALAYPHNDRAEVFFYAMTATGADFFGQEGLQAKLEVLCRGIREAYGLEKSPDTFLWEQYLQESLAHTE